MTPRAPDEIAVLAQLACALEVSAPKPGNVSPGRPFADTSFEDFLASAIAIGPALSRAGDQPLGRTIHAAVEATARVTERNTNLGIVLLLAPLARAALIDAPLRDALRSVLAATTVGDARDAYAAIRRAGPGGLGRAESQDVEHDPTVTLREAMALAASRDSIAREWTSDFALTFDTGAPALHHARAAGLSWSDAVVECFLALLAAAPDTLIARKLGPDAACEVSRQARQVLHRGGARTQEGRVAIEHFDRALRDDRNRRNPGTTADLTAAAIFVILVEHGWR
ncbi:MAG TPA: triphosphoribosyl-dephospho-CoA synthase [Gemmatimonadaceae bacterium]|jgi:triphosphoribosyl-dephospho-CoA synthase|nr:triphosphoribosyl-dephospho-CoA synthase [Gemmatimonadaceae bacterium]